MKIALHPLRLTIHLTAVLALAGAPFAHAGYNEGMAAYKKGDFATALTEFRKAGDQGNAAALFRLGALYADGQGVKQDQKQAFQLYKKGAELGSAEAQTAVGILYMHGRGTEQNDGEAIRWLTIRANKGDARAQYFLGTLYQKKNDTVSAKKLYRQAAEQGFVPARDAYFKLPQ